MATSGKASNLVFHNKDMAIIFKAKNLSVKGECYINNGVTKIRES